MKFSRGQAEFSAESEAYGDGFACLLPVASWLRRDVTGIQIMDVNLISKMNQILDRMNEIKKKQDHYKEELTAFKDKVQKDVIVLQQGLKSLNGDCEDLFEDIDDYAKTF